MTWPEPGGANLAESLISIKVKNVQHSLLRGLSTPKMKQKPMGHDRSWGWGWGWGWGGLAVGSICPNTKEEEKDQEEEDQRAKLQYVLEIKGS